jgi:hypothetical protein
MTAEVLRCGCSTAAAAACTGTAFDWLEPYQDGSCGCVCHAEYHDDPQHWQQYRFTYDQFIAEGASVDDWLDRLDAAEALTDETHDV